MNRTLMQKVTDNEKLLEKLRNRLQRAHLAHMDAITADDWSAKLVGLHRACLVELKEFIEWVELSELLKQTERRNRTQSDSEFKTDDYE